MLRVEYTAAGFFDFVKEDGRLVVDDGLETAVLMSLFTDAPASLDELTAAGLRRDQNRGWWGNDYAEKPGDVLGSKLWLLARAKRTDETLARAIGYASDAVAWLIADKLASKIPISAQWYGRTDFLALSVTMYRPGDLKPRWQRLWNATTGQILSP